MTKGYRGQCVRGMIYRSGPGPAGYRKDVASPPSSDTGPKAPRIPRATGGQTTAEDAMNDRIKNGGPLK